jgi:cystathionine beta-lyase
MTARPFDALSLAQLRQRSSLKWQHYGPDVLPLWVAEMDVHLAPEIVDVLDAAVRSGDTGYPNFGGTYKEALSEFASERWDWEPDPVDMLLCADVMSGIRAVLRRFAAPDGAVLIPSPVYPPFAMFTREIGRRVVPVGLTETGRLDVPAIDAALAREGSGQSADGEQGRTIVLLCSPHNPTGVVHTVDELAGVAATAQRRGALVVVDEVHAPLVPPGATFVPWHTVAAEGYVVTSAAKAFNLAGLKAALIVGSAGSGPLLRRMPESIGYGGSHLGVIGHAAGYRAEPSWLDSVNANIADNRVLLAQLLAQRLPGIRYRVPEASYLAWLDMRGLGLGADPASVLLRRGRIALTSGLRFGPGGSGHARLNLACSESVLVEAVDRMADAVARQAEVGAQEPGAVGGDSPDSPT